MHLEQEAWNPVLCETHIVLELNRDYNFTIVYLSTVFLVPRNADCSRKFSNKPVRKVFSVGNVVIRVTSNTNKQKIQPERF